MFHDNLLFLRKAKHLSQEELADQIGVSRQTLSKYETGEALPDIEKCKHLAERLCQWAERPASRQASVRYGQSGR